MHEASRDGRSPGCPVRRHTGLPGHLHKFPVISQTLYCTTPVIALLLLAANLKVLGFTEQSYLAYMYLKRNKRYGVISQDRSLDHTSSVTNSPTVSFFFRKKYKVQIPKIDCVLGLFIEIRGGQQLNESPPLVLLSSYPIGSSFGGLIVSLSAHFSLT